jgi:hypothetical protein
LYRYKPLKETLNTQIAALYCAHLFTRMLGVTGFDPILLKIESQQFQAK